MVLLKAGGKREILDVSIARANKEGQDESLGVEGVAKKGFRERHLSLRETSQTRTLN